MKLSNLSKKFGLVPVLALAGCGEVKETIELQGSYQSSANQELSARVSGIGCVVNQLEIHGTTMVMDQVTYGDKDCAKSPLAKIRTEGDFEIGKELDIAPGAREMDFKIASVGITILAPNWSEVVGIDISGDCNLADVAVGDTKNVAGMDCGLIGTFPNKDSIYFTSYSLFDGYLRFTKLPHEAREHLGTEKNPAPRNTDLKVKYLEK